MGGDRAQDRIVDWGRGMDEDMSLFLCLTLIQVARTVNLWICHPNVHLMKMCYVLHVESIATACGSVVMLVIAGFTQLVLV